jgi:hypothetical protein
MLQGNIMITCLKPSIKCLDDGNNTMDDKNKNDKKRRNHLILYQLNK